MFCTQCGRQLESTARFCPSCGKPVSEPPSTAAVPPFSATTRRLQRMMSEKKIAGVCAGFAHYFEVDVFVMRVIFVAMALLPPAVGVIAYLIAWVVIPKDTAVVV